MNPQELFVKKEAGENGFNYSPVQVWYCDGCKQVYSNQTLANDCCLPEICKCGNKCEKYYFSCPDCVKKQKIETEKEKFNKAQKLDIKDYNGYLLYDEYASDDDSLYFNNYFENICDFACIKCGGKTKPKSEKDIYSYLECQECKWISPEYEIIDDIYYLFAPEYIWAADFSPLELDLSHILENATQEHHETVNDYMKGTKELQDAIDKFNDLNKNTGSYNISNKLALINIKEYVKEMYKNE